MSDLSWKILLYRYSYRILIFTLLCKLLNFCGHNVSKMHPNRAEMYSIKNMEKTRASQVTSVFFTFLNFPGLFACSGFRTYLEEKWQQILLQIRPFFDLRICSVRPRALDILRREIQNGQKHWRLDLFLK